MSAYDLFLELMSYFCWYSTCFIVFIPRSVITSFNQFFAVPVHSSCILKLSGTGLVRDPSKKGYRTESRPDFKALNAISDGIQRYKCTLHSPIDSRWTPHIPHNSINSRWSPCGVHLILLILVIILWTPGGLYVFHLESRWN